MVQDPLQMDPGDLIKVSQEQEPLHNACEG